MKARALTYPFVAIGCIGFAMITQSLGAGLFVFGLTGLITEGVIGLLRYLDGKVK